MNKTKTPTLKTLWLQADQAASRFYVEHTRSRSWNTEHHDTYCGLRNRADTLWAEWMAFKTGKSAQEITRTCVESIHSKYD